MNPRKPYPYLAGILSLLLLIQSSGCALAFSAGAGHDDPWNPDHINLLPPEIRGSVLHMCRVRPNATHYFATFLDHARTIILHFENFNCEGRSIYHNAAGRCLHEEFVASGSHYQLTRTYYGSCND
jgi:hypothetical protein